MRPDRGRIMLGMCVALFFTLSIAIAPDAQASAGDLDPSFAKDGWLELAFSQEAEATALAIQDDGKILVSIGSRWSDLFGVARFLPDGTPDLSFGGQGYVLTDVAGKSSGEDLLLQPDGAIVIAGTSGKRMVVARYLADGTPDPSFDGDGRVSIRFGDRRTSLSAAAFDADGGIVLVGTSSRTMRRSKIAVVRLMASGEIDTSFSDDGKRLVVFGSCRCAGADDVVVAPDGRITVVGWAGTTALIVALDAGGGLDTTFSGDGIVRTRFLTAARWADATAVTLTSTGLILVAGVVPGGWGREVAWLDICRTDTEIPRSAAMVCGDSVPRSQTPSPSRRTGRSSSAGLSAAAVGRSCSSRSGASVRTVCTTVRSARTDWSGRGTSCPTTAGLRSHFSPTDGSWCPAVANRAAWS